MRKNLIISTVLAIVLCTAVPFSLSGEEKTDQVAFTDLIATTSETHLILFGVITNAFSDEMTSGLKSGVPVDFSFFVELHKNDGKGGSDLLTELQFRHTLTYDTLKDNYRVEFEEFNNKIISFVDLKEAQDTMREVNGVKILELAKLAPDSSYQLRIRADLFKKTLPLSLHRILPFLSWWDRETDWQTLEFSF